MIMYTCIYYYIDITNARTCGCNLCIHMYLLLFYRYNTCACGCNNDYNNEFIYSNMFDTVGAMVMGAEYYGILLQRPRVVESFLQRPAHQKAACSGPVKKDGPCLLNRPRPAAGLARGLREAFNLLFRTVYYMNDHIRSIICL